MAHASSIEATTPVPPDYLVTFARGVIARLAVWHTLRLAVDHSWGGPESAQKRTWMASVIVDAFDPSESPETPDADYIEDMLLQIMVDEFDVVMEDGSSEAVAKDIMNLWEMRETEDRIKTVVTQWEERANKTKGKKVASHEVINETAEVEGSGSEWEEDDGEGEDADEVPRLLDSSAQKRREEPEVDDEGFTLVKTKSKSRSK